jgi:hypothetical protein
VRKYQQALVPASIYPEEKCEEFDGSGWLVDVLSVTQQRAHVRFVHARNKQSNAWQPVWLSPSVLHKIPSSNIETMAAPQQRALPPTGMRVDG